MVRQAHHDTIVTLSLSKGWIPASAGMTKQKSFPSAASSGVYKFNKFF